MLILAVDTTSRQGSLALWRDGRVVETLVGDGSRTHGERLPLEVGAILSRIGASPGDVDLYAVIIGPGSFTGLRVGIAAVQGLAFALGRRVVPISAFEAYASFEEFDGLQVGIWRDAQRQQVFAAVHDRRGGSTAEIVPPVSAPPAVLAADWVGRGVVPDVFVGDGVEPYAPIVRASWPMARLAMPAPPLAPRAAVLAAARRDSAVAPHAIVPLYVRASDAELARGRNQDALENKKPGA